MQLIEQADFGAEMHSAGIIVDDGWFRLSFGRYEETDRFWMLPSPPQDMISLVSAILEHTGPMTYYDAWRPGGVWHEDDPSFTDAIRQILLGGFSIPPTHLGALRFERSESSAVIALALAFAVGGWNVNDDLCIVPGTRQFIVRVSHHAVIHVESRDSQLVMPLVSHMAAKGWALPTEVPDATFTIPAWMASKVPDAPT